MRRPYAAAAAGRGLRDAFRVPPKTHCCNRYSDEDVLAVTGDLSFEGPGVQPSFVVLFNNGIGEFTSNVTLDVPGWDSSLPTMVYEVQLGDIDGDGWLDIFYTFGEYVEPYLASYSTDLLDGGMSGNSTVFVLRYSDGGSGSPWSGEPVPILNLDRVFFGDWGPPAETRDAYKRLEVYQYTSIREWRVIANPKFIVKDVNGDGAVDIAFVGGGRRIAQLIYKTVVLYYDSVTTPYTVVSTEHEFLTDESYRSDPGGNVGILMGVAGASSFSLAWDRDLGDASYGAYSLVAESLRSNGRDDIVFRAPTSDGDSSLIDLFCSSGIASRLASSEFSSTFDCSWNRTNFDSVAPIYWASERLNLNSESPVHAAGVSQSASFDIGDFNEDGIADLLLCRLNESSAFEVRVYYGSPLAHMATAVNGTALPSVLLFATPSEFAKGAPSIQSCTAHDVNEDGIDDAAWIAVDESSGESYWLAEGEGASGSSTSFVPCSGCASESVAVPTFRDAVSLANSPTLGHLGRVSFVRRELGHPEDVVRSPERLVFVDGASAASLLSLTTNGSLAQRSYETTSLTSTSTSLTTSTVTTLTSSSSSSSSSSSTSTSETTSSSAPTTASSSTAATTATTATESTTTSANPATSTSEEDQGEGIVDDGPTGALSPGETALVTVGAIVVVGLVVSAAVGLVYFRLGRGASNSSDSRSRSSYSRASKHSSATSVSKNASSSAVSSSSGGSVETSDQSEPSSS